jgi:outer membrane lipoprotein carrier protein
MTAILLLALAADLPVAMKMIERRYNAAATMAVRFEQRYQTGGRTRVESGTVSLRKPGRMRWEYANPEGKLLISDGKTVWFYSPSANRVERSPVRESEDLRVPLGFLLGRLNFGRDFRDMRIENGEVIALPKSAKAPYREVRFRASEAGTIEEVRVTGQDATVMEFRFAGERLNVPLADSLFRFTPPAGAEVVDVTAP